MLPQQSLGLSDDNYLYDDAQSAYSGTEPGSPVSLNSVDNLQYIESKIDRKDEIKKANLFMTTFNVVNSIIGSGIIGMPYALRGAGIGMGLILLVTVSIVTDYSLNLLILGGFMSNTNNYQDLVRNVYGRVGFLILTVMQGTYPFIAMISYNVIIGDTVTRLAKRIGDLSDDSIFTDRKLIVFICTLFFTFPLSLYRQIASLTKISVASTTIIILIIGTMAIRGPSYIIIYSRNDWNFINYRIPQAIAIMAFAFMCQHNSFLCYQSLKKKSTDRWGVVVHIAVSFSFMASGLFGIIGYSTFTGYTQGDVLENYCFKDDLINVSRLLFAITIIFTYPVECFVAREVIENSFFYKSKPVSKMLHFFLTLIIVTAAMCISMTTNCVSIVLEINGILTAAPLAFIIPPICILRLQNEPILQLKNIPSLATLGLGVIVMVSGVIVVVMDLVGGVNCTHGELLPYCRPITSNSSISNSKFS
uniref:Putative sodium-coupled neutral amino acid transporter 11 n=1 Tax=Schmidtea mediterranea TaxID=79327 RepID=A0A0H3YKH2_SCHMD|nr:slc38a-4 [Schmidtea mediterranea]